MSLIPDEVIEQVRDAADIVGLIGAHVELKRTGTDYRGPCPFHGGTHRNFAVIPKKQMFYCYVCHEAGDVFTFYMKKLGLDYPTAVREVARESGITIPERPSAGPDPREPLYSAVAAAAEWYARRLREGEDAEGARKYLQSRGFALEGLYPHGLGYAPRGDAFLDAMRTLGVAPAVLREAGLTVEREAPNARPRFWGRLLFPIHDLRGRVVGFGGRVIGEGEPKYLNSPETPIFHKGGLLYNLHQAKPAIRKAERAVVVEGYFDVLRLLEAGLEETVAPLGTSLTPDQATLLKRLTHDVLLLYDSDAAGLRSTFRAADVMLSAGLRVLIATAPPGQDPDTLVAKSGADAVRRVLDDAIDVLERKLQLLERKGWLGTLDGRRRGLDRLLPTLRAASDPVTRDLYVTRTAEALGVSRSSIEREMASAPWRPAAPVRTTAEPDRADASVRLTPAVRDLLRILLNSPKWRPRVQEQLARLPGSERAERRLLAAVAGQDASVAGGSVLPLVDPAYRGIVQVLLAGVWGEMNEDAVVEGALRRMEGEVVEERLRAIDRRLPLAADEEQVALTREKEDLSRKMRVLNPARWNVIRKGRSGSAR
jgi:DNA primase